MSARKALSDEAKAFLRGARAKSRFSVDGSHQQVIKELEQGGYVTRTGNDGGFANNQIIWAYTRKAQNIAETLAQLDAATEGSQRERVAGAFEALHEWQEGRD
jgi:hypothetical protein